MSSHLNLTFLKQPKFHPSSTPFHPTLTCQTLHMGLALRIRLIPGIRPTLFRCLALLLHLHLHLRIRLDPHLCLFPQVCLALRISFTLHLPKRMCLRICLTLHICLSLQTRFHLISIHLMVFIALDLCEPLVLQKEKRLVSVTILPPFPVPSPSPQPMINRSSLPTLIYLQRMT